MEEKDPPELIRFKKPSGAIKLKIKKNKLTQNHQNGFQTP